MTETKGEATWLISGAERDRQSITKDWTPVDRELIDGVQLTDVRPVATGYGYLIEMFRPEWHADNPRIDQIFTSCLMPGGISAWHAHGETVDRLFVAHGLMHIVLYDGREGSPTFGRINQFRLGPVRPGMLIIPKRVWHGVKNVGADPAYLINAVDRAYQYEHPDHWRAPHDSPEIPFRF